EVPGWGILEGRLAKTSVRVSRNMQTIIDQGKIPSAVDLLIKASKGFGVVGGHMYAANVIIPVDKKEVLIENAEEVAST
ncbi:MAG: hypothetical protein JSV12_05575, partial [Candidatus Bathyarchaeota archaeon]